ATRLKNARRLTFDDSHDFPAAWTPDSKAVLFCSNRNGNYDIFKQTLDQRDAEPIVASAEQEYDPTVSPDGAWVFYFALPTFLRITSASPVSLKRVPLSGGPPQLMLSERGFAHVRCARSPSNLCIVDRRDQSKLILYAFDPVKGRGRELTRIDI